MRIVVHDYSGHVFQVQLSRSLARRGHEVLHMFSSSFLTPQGALQKTAEDPVGFTPQPIVLSEMVAKGNFVKRRRQDALHGRLAAEKIASFKPDAVLSANTPLDAQKLILGAAKQCNSRFVFWVQDLIGQAAFRLLGPRFPIVGKAAGRAFIRFEESLLRQSDAVVVISDDFLPYIPSSRHAVTTVIENWAPLHEIPLRPRGNSWAEAKGFADGLNFVYSGTIGLKHNHNLLVAMAEALKPIPGARVIVISEGDKAKLIAQERITRGLENLHVLPFQPFRDFPDALGAADVLMAILEPDAGVFSVPSKVLSCLCSGRPILAAMPQENLAAKIVASQGAGYVVAPNDVDAFVTQGLALAQNEQARTEMGRKGRAYAERTFEIESITDRFEEVLLARGASRPAKVLSA